MGELRYFVIHAEAHGPLQIEECDEQDDVFAVVENLGDRRILRVIYGDELKITQKTILMDLNGVEWNSGAPVDTSEGTSPEVIQVVAETTAEPVETIDRCPTCGSDTFQLYDDDSIRCAVGHIVGHR